MMDVTNKGTRLDWGTFETNGSCEIQRRMHLQDPLRKYK